MNCNDIFEQSFNLTLQYFILIFQKAFQNSKIIRNMTLNFK